MRVELILLQKTLDLDADKRATSRELLDVYIKEYEKDVGFDRKKNKVSEHKRNASQTQTVRRDRIMTANSIETIEKRVPSF